MFLLQRGSETLDVLYDHLSTDIANTLKYCKRPVPPDLHFYINVDNATEGNATNIGNKICEYLCDKLGVDQSNPIYINKHDFHYDLRRFHVTVSFHFFIFIFI